MSQETKKEEWEKKIRNAGDFHTEAPVVHASDVRSLLSSHDAELRRKIEGMLPVAGVRNGAWLIEEDAVLALLRNK